MAALSNNAKNLVICESQSYGAVLNLLNEFGRKNPSLQIIECINRGEKSTLILFCPDELLPVLRDAQRVEAAVIEDPHPDLLPAYLNLKPSQLGEKLYIFEGSKIATLLKVANELLRAQLSVFDIRSLRGKAGAGYVLATGGQLGQPTADRIRALGSLTEVAQPTMALKELFEIQTD